MPVHIAGRGGPTPMRNVFVAEKTRTPVRYRLTGTTRDATGDILPYCTIKIYESATGRLYAETVSDGNGSYGVDVNGPATGMMFFATAFSHDSPLRAGCTLDTLVGEHA